MSLVALTEEQLALVAVVDRLVDATSRTSPRAGDPMPFDTIAWWHLVDTGLLGIAIDEEAGGSGGTTLDLALVVERLATGPAAVPYLGTVLALALLDCVATDAPPDDAPAVAELRTRILDGRPAAVVLDRDLLAPGHSGIGFDATPESILIGCDGTTLFAVEHGLEPTECVDLTRRLATSAAATRLAPVAPDRRQRWTARALALMSADLLGAMSGALAEAVTHANDRVQYGQAIGSFQAIQHLCADQLVTIEAARSTMWHAAWASDVLPAGEAIEAARIAKAYASSGAWEVTEAAIQVWGGIGMTWEGRAHLFLRRALLSRQVLGDDDHHIAAITLALTGPAGPDDPS